MKIKRFIDNYIRNTEIKFEDMVNDFIKDKNVFQIEYNSETENSYAVLVILYE